VDQFAKFTVEFVDGKKVSFDAVQILPNGVLKCGTEHLVRAQAGQPGSTVRREMEEKFYAPHTWVCVIPAQRRPVFE
jgi:hypothetical protein